MLIHSVKANQSLFKTVEFHPGFNVILADRTEISDQKDSRNGLGKSTLIAIIHFCLGANIDRKNKLHKSYLPGWTFSLDLTLANSMIIATRSIDKPSQIEIEGDTTDWEIQPKQQNGKNILKLDSWKAILGNLIFGLPINSQDRQFSPTFRSLIPYFIRRGRDAYSTPFEHYRKQVEWDKQINNSFLLGLGWEYSRDLQRLKDRKKLLDNIKQLKKTTEEGARSAILGNLGELEAYKVQTEQLLNAKEANLLNFQVYPEYHELEQNADRLTREIHDATNENLINQRLKQCYLSSLEQENEPDRNELINLYQSADVELPNLVIRRLEDVTRFHNEIVQNRQEFLESEIKKLSDLIEKTNGIIRQKTTERASLLEVLQTHGALEEHTKLQSLYLDTKADLNEINRRIEELRQFEEDKSALKIETERLIMSMKRDLRERDIQKNLAISFFNSNSQELYNTPGELIINVVDKGYNFNVNIARDGSEGIGNMKIFCYDLTLAQLWSGRNPAPNILIHDSTIFDGVDERQIALALELVARESSQRTFQYICTLNSDMIPESEFSDNFDFSSYIRLRLTDENDSGKLLGIPF
ncbi:ABC-three component system protein [Spirulina sp. 06S082]|uniref:ABC-three component system protein n=1 Tax=Spirulina sp. 06S082 TaxID=3110248 RepID=UPI002B1FFADB|nr:ABC-three component system protein [Spirulina sp. 06S082]MEA5470354.1 ABC-three component system protein [Spirulina sp. 06S082]